jgi:hypothetical protein
MIKAISLDRTRLFSIVKILWLLAVVVGGIFYIAKNYALASQYIQTIELPRLVLSFVLILLMRTMHPHLVQRSLVLADSYLDFQQVFSIVSISQLGKYIPGGIWQFVARFSAYKENQLSYKGMGVSFIIENVWLVFGSLFVGIFFIFLGGPATPLQQTSSAAAVFFYLMIACLAILFWIATLFATEYGVRSANRQPSWRAALIQFVSQTSMWVFLGLSFALLFQDLASFSDVSQVAGAFIWSFLAGYLAIFAPGGIGVREYVAVLLLSSLFASNEVGMVTILHRVLYTLAEFLLAGVAYLLNRKIRLASDLPVASAAAEERLNEG